MYPSFHLRSYDKSSIFFHNDYYIWRIFYSVSLTNEHEQMHICLVMCSFMSVQLDSFMSVRLGSCDNILLLIFYLFVLWCKLLIYSLDILGVISDSWLNLYKFMIIILKLICNHLCLIVCYCCLCSFARLDPLYLSVH